ncbi:hypothetical protein C1T17_16130 [Sphingobium sp. SCG-1]|uniref:VOC family protein n=1 Tax=Sphingobium sp. SCG-1 TaxID=2072936 RepID=UPI000CD679E8|nr:VOC family protein [Sphingobium sp. SCG-1]AUW59389.1 hypothetical protein C1T17_16130 [Sphingobium sp. SCG-1]
MTGTSYPAGNPFVWYELMTSDVTAAKQFYGTLMGWSMSEVEAGGEPYTILSADGQGIGGIMRIPAVAAGSARPGWFGYVGVPDASAAVEAMAADGASVHMPVTHIPEVGHIAMLADPQGATFYVIQPEGEGPATSFSAMPSAGKFGWNELHAGELAGALAFYTRHMGWKAFDGMDMGPMGTYQFYGLEGTTLGGMMTKTPDTPRPEWKHYAWVDDIDAAASRVTEGGGQIVHGPSPVPGDLFMVQITDPQGAAFAMVGHRKN